MLKVIGNQEVTYFAEIPDVLTFQILGIDVLAVIVVLKGMATLLKHYLWQVQAASHFFFTWLNQVWHGTLLEAPDDATD